MDNLQFLALLVAAILALLILRKESRAILQATANRIGALSSRPSSRMKHSDRWIIAIACLLLLAILFILIQPLLWRFLFSEAPPEGAVDLANLIATVVAVVSIGVASVGLIAYRSLERIRSDVDVSAATAQKEGKEAVDAAAQARDAAAQARDAATKAGEAADQAGEEGKAARDAAGQAQAVGDEAREAALQAQKLGGEALAAARVAYVATNFLRANLYLFNSFSLWRSHEELWETQSYSAIALRRDELSYLLETSIGFGERALELLLEIKKLQGDEYSSLVSEATLLIPNVANNLAYQLATRIKDEDDKEKALQLIRDHVLSQRDGYHEEETITWVCLRCSKPEGDNRNKAESLFRRLMERSDVGPDWKSRMKAKYRLVFEPVLGRGPWSAS